MQDRIKWFNMSKCYGFIEAEDGQDYFVHERAIIEGTPCDNALVKFDVGSNAKGLLRRQRPGSLTAHVSASICSPDRSRG